jgi:glyoxylase-like metal-dependent hydrolase (beta-lactamase superfamily II)
MRVHRIAARETNCYLLWGRRGVVLIDAGPPGSAETVIAGAKEAGVRAEDLRLILITHGHLDHYGAAAEIREWCGAPVAAYPGEPEFSQDRRNALPPAQTVRGSLVRWTYMLLSPMARFEPLEADILLDDKAALLNYGLEAWTVLLPGHSPGSLGVITPDGDLFAGDLFVNYAVPSQPIYLSDPEAWQQSYERVLELRPRMVYVGHGEPFPGVDLDPIYPARYQYRWWVR